MERHDSRGIIIDVHMGVVMNGGIKQSQIVGENNDNNNNNNNNHNYWEQWVMFAGAFNKMSKIHLLYFIR